MVFSLHVVSIGGWWFLWWFGVVAFRCLFASVYWLVRVRLGGFSLDFDLVVAHGCLCLSKWVGWIA